MYSVDKKDSVRELDLPQMDPGAPCPKVVADDSSIEVSYYIRDGELRNSLRVKVEFQHPRCFYFGPPNDEALSGHPLSERGLESYGVFEVVNSSWIRSLERMNRVHIHHDPNRFKELRHFIFTFHDKTFECVAEGYTSERPV